MSINMGTYSAAEKFAGMSDELLFSTEVVVWQGEGDIYNAEKAKRLRARNEERRRIERERMERLKQRKNAVIYSDELAQEICERIASGELLTVICLDEHMPTVRKANTWLHEHTEFKILFDQSLQDRLNIFEEQIIQFPDEAAHEYIEVKKGNTVQRVQDTGKVQAAKLQVEVRRLHLKAGRPAKWGDSATIITKSADEFDPANMSAEDLERHIAEIEKKSRVVRAA